jgi:hypothetical protein
MHFHRKRIVEKPRGVFFTLELAMARGAEDIVRAFQGARVPDPWFLRLSKPPQRRQLDAFAGNMPRRGLEAPGS